jgi:hypothetical protein
MATRSKCLGAMGSVAPRLKPSNSRSAHTKSAPRSVRSSNSSSNPVSLLSPTSRAGDLRMDSSSLSTHLSTTSSFACHLLPRKRRRPVLSCGGGSCRGMFPPGKPALSSPFFTDRPGHRAALRASRSKRKPKQHFSGVDIGKWLPDASRRPLTPPVRRLSTTIVIF